MAARVLVVDDHPLNRELVVDLLEAAGYTVRQAADGRGLLARVQTERELNDSNPPNLLCIDAMRHTHPIQRGKRLTHFASA